MSSRRASSSRRGFLGGCAAAFAFRDATSARLDRLDFARAHPEDDEFWLELRDHFDIDPERICFNHAGLSPSPRAVHEALAAELRRANGDPSYVIWREQDREIEAVRSRLARLMGCLDAELALTPNATHGLQTAILGLPLSEGDEIVTTAHDYSRTFDALRQRERRDGTKTVVVPLATPPASAEEIAAAITAALTSRTRLVVLSRMTYLTGQLLPVREVAAVLAPRGIPLLVDAAHAIGLLAEGAAELGGAFTTACLHKWLMGPVGTGVFAVQSAWIDKLWPLHPASESLGRRIGKFEQFGTRPAAPFLALKEALDLHERLGCDRKAARLEALRARLGRSLIDARGVRFYGSLDPERCRALLSLGFEKVPSRALADWLWKQHRMHVTVSDAGGIDALRLSPNVFTTHAEIDRLASLLRTVAERGI